MLSPALEKLLIFQDRDMRRVALETQIRRVPEEITALRKKIAHELSTVDTSKAQWREAEGKGKTIENDIGSAEQRIARFKSQQAEVRKNDEYQALGHEIEEAEKALGLLEEEEIKALFAIDEAKEKVKAAEATAKAGVAQHERAIATLEERERTLKAELDAHTATLEAARKDVAESSLVIYARIAKANSLPVVVAIRDHKCSGCHLKVSSGVESEARSSQAQKVTTCDNCGRLVYVET